MSHGRRRRFSIPIPISDRARVAATAAAACAWLGCAPGQAIPAAPPAPDLHFESGAMRRDLRFACGDDTCAGWLYLPGAVPAGATPPPVVVMAHGFAGTRDVALPAFAEAFAEAGIAAFVFDYRHFGASGGAPRQLIDPWRQLDDWRAAIAFVRGREDVDAGALILWGTSQGAGHALLIAAEDPGVRALLLQAPLVDTGVEGEAAETSPGWIARILFTAWGDLLKSLWSDEALTLPAMAPPGEFGMLVDQAAYDAFVKLVSPDSTYRNAVAARSILTYDEYNPAVAIDRISMPVLVIASRGDRFAPFSAVEDFARRAPTVAVDTFEGDHFDIYSPPASTQAMARQVAFVQALR
jgi:pimeloyl-ACP methyl ester carboxylesterase